tara:strand:+ start:168 stop:497 length:330 start_codon:yes stop_codon:yes gene_type:complete
MAQDFESTFQANIMTGSYTTLLNSDSDDAIIGLRFANKHSGSVTVDAKIVSASVSYHVIKEAPLPAGGSLELIDGGSKVVIQSGSILFARTSKTGSVDTIVSYIDTISE